MQQSVGLIIERGSEILLIEKSVGGEFELPSGSVYEGEGLMSAMDRIAREETGLTLSNVGEFINHVDTEKGRELRFVVRAHDAYEVQLRAGHIGYAWVEPEEALSHPVREDVMWSLDFYMKQRDAKKQLGSYDSTW